jgi:hypothetical protein
LVRTATTAARIGMCLLAALLVGHREGRRLGVPGNAELPVVARPVDLPQELARAGITDMASANRYLDQVYRPGHNREFGVLRELRGPEPADPGGRDALPLRSHPRARARARASLRGRVDETLAVFHGPRKLAAYDATGLPATEKEVLRLAA